MSVELVSGIVMKVKNDKAAGSDNLSCEHLKYTVIHTYHCIVQAVYSVSGQWVRS